MNKSKAKGTSAETAVVSYAWDNGYPWALRPAQRGTNDVADVWLTPGPGLVAEVKSHKGGPELGQPAPGVLASWLAEAETERRNAGADVALLIVKRKGTTDVGKWWAYITAGVLLALIGSPVIPPDADAPICLTVASALRLMRAAGYGHPLENGDE